MLGYAAVAEFKLVLLFRNGWSVFLIICQYYGNHNNNS